MKRMTIQMIGAALVLALTPVMTLAQALTPAQTAAKAAKDASMQQAAAYSKILSAGQSQQTLSPEQLRLMDPRYAVTSEALVPSPPVAQTKIVVNQVDELPLEQDQYGDSLVGGCGSDPYTRYGVPDFYNWQKRSSTNGFAWTTNKFNTITFTNTPSFESPDSSFYPPNSITTMVSTPVSTDYDQFGDPAAHKLTFSYQYFGPVTGGSIETDIIRCSVASSAAPMGDLGFAYTNLPVSTTWRKVTLMVPARVLPSTEVIEFTVFKGSTQNAHQGPDLYIANTVQWCAVDIPNPVLNCAYDGTNVTLYWDALTYPTNLWHLQYTGDVTGPYADISVPMSITAGIANVTFDTTTNDMRYYRMVHVGP